MQKGFTAFEDLREGMVITGKIKNVVDFGAFVDLGIKETALVHISELGDHFIKNPLEAVKAGDLLEFRIISLDKDRRRIGLSRKSGQPEARGEKIRDRGGNGGPADRRGGTGRHKAPGPGGGSYAADGSPARGSHAADGSADGTMYNPFAEAFKRMGKTPEHHG
jgi:uncharacterized protein